jgi:hypothetical protein
VLTIPAPLRKAGAAETAAALSTLREMVGDRVMHDGSPDLERQMIQARVMVGPALRLVSGPRSDLLRAAVWALRVAAGQPSAPAGRLTIY